MQPFTMGYVSATPITHFFPTTVATVRFVRFDTINQVLHSLGSHSVDLLAVEVRWFSDPKECDAIIEMAKHQGTPVLLLTSYVQPGISQLTSLDPAEFLTQRHTPPSCVQFVPVVSHNGQALSLSSRAVQLLAIFVTYPGQVLRLVDINQESKSRHIAPWTTHSLKSAIHSITQQVSRRHIKNIRGFGYMFQSCRSSSYQHDSEDSVPEDMISK